MLINQLSKETNTAIATIRFYEKLGLFKGKKKEDKTSNNYTYYDEEVIDKLDLIKNAKTVGFTLLEIKDLIDAWYSKQFSKEEKFKILDNKIIQINAKIKDLNNIKKQISVLKNEIVEFDC